MDDKAALCMFGCSVNLMGVCLLTEFDGCLFAH